MTSKTIGILLICIATSAMSAFEFKNAVIYCPKNAPPSVMKAAKELQTHLKPVIGKQLDIVRRPRSPMIALGDSESARKAGIDLSGFAYEEYRMLTHGQDLFIAGKDLRNDGPTKYGNKDGGRSYGTLYAVYDFLEYQIGISWLTPGPKGIWYPPKNPDLKIESLDIRYKPRFAMRQIIWYLFISPFSNDPLIREWLTFNRYNHYIVAGPNYWRDQHSWPHLYPREGGRDANLSLLKSREATFREHPEYFQLSPDGKRVPPVGNVYLCISNPAVSDDIAQRIRTLSKRSKGKHMVFYMSPTDGAPYCNCKECQSQTEMLDPAVIGPTGLNFLKQSWTKLVMNYYRRVAEQLPDILLRGYVYQRYEFVPREGVSKMPDNIIGGMAPLQTAYGPIRLYSPINETWKKWEKSWRGVFKQKVYFSLDFWLNQNAGAPMSPYPGMLKDTFDAINADPAYVGYTVFLNPGFGHSSILNWMMTKLLWNSKLDPYQLMDQYLNKAYGGAAPKIRELYQLLEKSMTRFMTDRKGQVGYHMTPDMLAEVYAAEWNRVEQLYLDAQKYSMDENQKWRLAMLGENLKLLRYHLVQLNFIKDTPSPLKMSPAEFQVFNKRRLPGGDLFFHVNPPSLTIHMRRAAVKLNSVRPVRAEEIKNREKSRYSSYFRYHQDIIVYADKDGNAEFQLETESEKDPRTGKAYLPQIAYYTVLDRNGKIYYHSIAKQGRITFPVRKGEYYYLFYSPMGEVVAYYRWKVKSANMPFALGSKIKSDSTLMVWAMKDPLYFRIPENLPEMQIHFNGIRLNVELIAPDGKTYQSERKKNTRYYRFEIKKPVAGWWKIKFKDPEGFRGTIHCGKGLNGYFVLDPDLALDIQEGKGSVLSIK